MNKYDDYDNYYSEHSNTVQLEDVLAPGEKILWRGAPNKTAYMLNSIFGPIAFFAILWLAIDGFFIYSMISSGEFKEMLGFIIPFFALHLFPVWIWLGGIISASRRWKNTEYAITEKRILIKSGFFGIDFKSLYYTDIKNATLRKGAIDSMFGVADIYFYIGDYSDMGTDNENSFRFVMFDLDEPYEVYKRVQKIILDKQNEVQNSNRKERNFEYDTNYNDML